MVHGFKLEIGVMLWLPIFLVLWARGADCDKVKFYGKTNYEGFIEEYDLSGDDGRRCRTFMFNSLEIKSMKTDRCIMLFGSLGCEIRYGDPSYSLRVDADTPEVTGTLNAEDTQIVHSFGPCSRERGGGPEVDVDFYSEADYNGESTASYRDVCGCQNLKESAVGGKSRKISMDNHGHDIDLFEGEHCTGQMRSVKAGSNWASRLMWDPRDEMAYFDIRSFRPTNLKNCTKRSESFHKLKSEDGSQEMIDGATKENVKIAIDAPTRNNVGMPVDGHRIEFYGKPNYEDFLKQFRLSGDEAKKCQNLGNGLDVKSLKTNRCIMLYGNGRCNQDRPFSYSLRFDTDTPLIDQTLSDWDAPQTAKSFSICSRELGGGPEVDVDFYHDQDFQGPISFQFRDVCSCRHLEKWAVGGKSRAISVDNHGHSLDFFEGEHCTGQMRTVRAGVNWANRWMWDSRDHMGFFDVQSFRPTNFESCMDLDASIYKFVFANGTAEMIKNTTEQNVTLATDSTLRNNGGQSIVLEYAVNNKVSEGLDITTSTGFSNMHTVKAGVTASSEVEAGIPFVGAAKIRVQVALEYQYQRKDDGSKVNRTNIVTEDALTVSQKITIQPCRECLATSFVKKLRNFPIKYTAYSRVTGTAAGDKMSAQEIRSALLPEVTYLGDVDEYTVDTKVEGVMFADFGLNTFVNVDCKVIPDCVAAPPKPDVKVEPLSMQFIQPINRAV